MTNKRTKIEEISFEDFNEKYMQPKEDWDFSLFKILCNKCKSTNVEFAGKTEVDYGYYGSIEFEHKIIIKCHDCGNAFGIKNTDGGSTTYCTCDNS